jgi:ATP-dependent helicase HrpB
MQTEKRPLPIDSWIPKILEATRHFSTVMVKASPGSGKTTRLPWAISSNLNKKVVVLEPRRLAAKLAATRIASEEGLRLGEEVGFHFRFEKNISEKTQLIFCTEGTFLKTFLSDPDLAGVDVVILDEFHERHLETDLAFAFLRSLQQKRDLKLILMSATLDLNINLENTKIFEIDAQMYPVEISYLPNTPSILNASLESKVKNAVNLIGEKNILVFLPGMREMLRVQNVLENNVYLLHADLSKEEQHEALKPSVKQKIILATNIAESSVTIPGVSAVIDSGIQRESHYNPWNGLKFIQDSRATKSSATQRAGRAGRTAPGICIRLYSQQDYMERAEHTIPEIERADLTDTYLLTAALKETPLWIQPPNQEKWEKAKKILTKLGAIENDSLTTIGKKMLRYPLDARLSRILVAAETLRNIDPIFKFICEEIEEDRTGTLRKRLQIYKTSGTEDFPWEKCVLYGFPDQVARYRTKHKDFIHYSGKTIRVHNSLDLNDGYYLILDITQKQEAIKVFPIEEEWLYELVPFPFIEEEEISISEKIILKQKTKYGSIVIDETVRKMTYDQLSLNMKTKLREVSVVRIAEKISQWKETPEFGKIAFWHKIQNKEMNLFVDVEDFFNLYPDLDFEFIPEYLRSRFPDPNTDLPTKINLVGKRELIVHYPCGMDPYLEAPIQDFYGINETPSIMHGRYPLTLKLLGPHKRPIQVTKDLKNFWLRTYQEMKKEYQREYPRHYWPDKPWEAEPVLLKRMLKP